jgi:hypothetical protein
MDRELMKGEADKAKREMKKAVARSLSKEEGADRYQGSRGTSHRRSE